MREQLQWFANEMEKTLKDNDHKGGWESDNDLYFIERLREEVDELDREFGLTKRGKDLQSIIKEATDVSNFAMMIADRARKKLND